MLKPPLTLCNRGLRRRWTLAAAYRGLLVASSNCPTSKVAGSAAGAHTEVETKDLINTDYSLAHSSWDSAAHSSSTSKSIGAGLSFAPADLPQSGAISKPAFHSTIAPG